MRLFFKEYVGKKIGAFLHEKIKDIVNWFQCLWKISFVVYVLMVDLS